MQPATVVEQTMLESEIYKNIIGGDGDAEEQKTKRFFERKPVFNHNQAYRSEEENFPNYEQDLRDMP